MKFDESNTQATLTIFLGGSGKEALSRQKSMTESQEELKPLQSRRSYEGALEEAIIPKNI